MKLRNWKSSLPPALYIKTMKKIWKHKISPFGVMRKGGRVLFSCAFKHKVKDSFYNLQKDEIKDYKRYLK